MDWTYIALTLIAVVVAPIIIIHYKEWRLKRLKYKKINKRIEVDVKINEELAFLLGATTASRVRIFQLHPELCPQFISMAYEKVAVGISKHIDELQNLILSEYTELLNSLKDTGWYMVEDVSKLTDESLKMLLIGQGIKSTYMRAVYSSSKFLKGYITVNFNKKTEIDKDIEKLLIEKSYYLSKHLGEYES